MNLYDFFPSVKRKIIKLFLCSALMFISGTAYAQLLDVKPPADPPAGRLWVYVLMSIGLVALLFLVWWFFIRRSKKAAPAPVVVPPRDPYDVALEQLQELENKNYIQMQNYKSFYSELSDVIRQFIESKFSIRAPEMTTEEFLHFVNYSSKLSAKYTGLLKEFLHACDMVKFARHTPELLEVEQTLDLAKNFIDETGKHSDRG